MANPRFTSIIDEISEIGRKKHATRLLENARLNQKHVKRSIKDLPPPTGKKALSGFVMSGGPTLRKREILPRFKNSQYPGSLICAEASYLACISQGIFPDYVLTLDPHPTRIVRWFGDPNFEEHTKKDDYFQRQDLDIEFRNASIKKNLENIELVNRHGSKTKAIVSSTAPANVLERLKEAGFEIYWWNPLVDDPKAPESLTRELFKINRLPAFNTGGNVGTAAWVFATQILGLPRVGMAGMDFGYYADTPQNLTQTYYELIQHLGGTVGLDDCFIPFEFPLTKERFFTDPTYFWYRKNFLELASIGAKPVYNCSEGGTLFGDGIECLRLEDFLGAA